MSGSARVPLSIGPRDPLPPASTALRHPDGLVAIGRDLSAHRLLEAYRKGIFPWFSEGDPVLWWSPDPRMVAFTAEFEIGRSLRKTLRRIRQPGGWRITMDQCFPAVMRACAAPRPDQNGTWISPQIVHAYTDLHKAGFAHSFEVWAAPDPRDDSFRTGLPTARMPVNAHGEVLIGGLYGVAIGRMFYGESMFTRRVDASKCAYAALMSLLGTCQFPMVDCQQKTSHLSSLGARVIARDDFLARMGTACLMPAPDWKQMQPAWPDL